MKLRILLLSILICVVFVPAAFAFNQDGTGGTTDGCGEIDPSQPCYAGGGGTTYTFCTKPEGCPLCGENANTGATICFVVFAQPYGHCSCKPKGRFTDKYGVSYPYCETSGACRARR